MSRKFLECQKCGWKSPIEEDEEHLQYVYEDHYYNYHLLSAIVWEEDVDFVESEEGIVYL